MKSAGKARNNGLYRHIRTSKEIIRNLLNDYKEVARRIGQEYCVLMASSINYSQDLRLYVKDYRK